MHKQGAPAETPGFMSCCWWFGVRLSMLKATKPAFTALLTTKAEAWPVRVASTHEMSHSRHTPRLKSVDTGWVWMMLMVLELLLVVWSRPQHAESH